MQHLILLHGALGTARSLQPLSQALEGYARTHTLDFAGHGAAAWPDEGFTMEVFEQDVLRLMDRLGLESAHVFGYSLGGYIGLRLAKDFPERISSVNTLATKFDWDEETCDREATMLDPDVLEAKAPKFIAGLVEAHTANGWRKVMTETRSMLRAMSGYRFSPQDLADISTKVRLMVGDRDKMVSIDETRKIYRALPNAGLAVLPGTPHPLDAANPELLTAHILTALAEN